MFSFFKKDKNSNMPEWASFFSSREYLIFIEEIHKYFEKISTTYSIFDGVINVEETVFGHNQLGLLNVGQVCKQSEMEEYGEIIKEHFDALIRTHKFGDYFETIISDFDMIKPYLGVRLYNNDYFEAVGIKNIIGIPLTERINSTLIFDLPDSIRNVKPEEAEKWNLDTNELLKIGVNNIQQKYGWEITKEKIGNFYIWFIQSDHFFAPNIVFDLENRSEISSENGILIAMPHRHAVLIYPIKTLEVVEAINSFIPIVYGMNQEGPGSLTNQIYYYKSEKLLNLPYELSEGKIHFSPPDEFVEVLNKLQ
jgi:hypothetical protein